MTKPTPKQLAIMAAVLGISNCGQDSLFRGSNALIKPENMKLYIKDNDSVETIAWSFCNLFCETEEMAEYHIREVKSWVKILRRMSVEKIKSTWPDYADFC
jgi:hypothetical protein